MTRAIIENKKIVGFEAIKETKGYEITVEEKKKRRDGAKKLYLERFAE